MMLNLRVVIVVQLLLGAIVLNAHLAIVSIPIADLYYMPEKVDESVRLPTTDQTNSLLITQLLMGDHVVVYDDFEYQDPFGVDWVKVAVLQQTFYTPSVGWHGYIGWIVKDNILEVDTYPSTNLVVRSQKADLYIVQSESTITLSIGTRLHGISQHEGRWIVILPDHSIGYINSLDVHEYLKDLDASAQDYRAHIVTTAHDFLGYWYSWGGRSAQMDHRTISSVDCSGLVGLSFLANGLQLPRMSHEQYLFSRKIDRASDLQPGDLVFFNDPVKSINRMSHVMLYVGGELLLEATYAGNHKARLVTFKERFGKDRADCKSGDLIDGEGNNYLIHFGSVLDDENLICLMQCAAARTSYDESFYNACHTVHYKGICESRYMH